VLFVSRLSKFAVSGLLLLAAQVTLGADMADLHAQTIAAFDRYVRLTEARMARETNGEAPFIWTDSFAEPQKATAIGDLKRGQLVIDSLTTKDGGRKIDVPDGLIHHWVGVVFVPGGTVDKAVALLQDYDRHAEIYKPAVARSKILSHTGSDYRVYLRFYMKKVLTVVLNTEHEARFVRPRAGQAYSQIHSTRIAEVENPDTPAEREKPIGRDGGYMWRLNTYWRFLERDGGTYVQCESISLTRGIPLGFGWLVGPFVTSIPRESLTFTLETTRKTLLK
jgi:hypothetical protein